MIFLIAIVGILGAACLAALAFIVLAPPLEENAERVDEILTETIHSSPPSKDQ